jgi:hypothetical protein
MTRIGIVILSKNKDVIIKNWYWYFIIVKKSAMPNPDTQYILISLMLSFVDYLKGRYSGRASFSHMIDIVLVKCVKTFFLLHFLPPGVQNSISGSSV